MSEIENLDELEVYGDSDKAAGTTLTSYVFEVRAHACVSHTSVHTPAITLLLIRLSFDVFVYSEYLLRRCLHTLAITTHS